MLDSEDAEVKAIALISVDAKTENARLLEWLGDASSSLRRAAAERLGLFSGSDDARIALGRVARGGS